MCKIAFFGDRPKKLKIANRLGSLMSHHWGYVGAVVSAILFGVSSTLNKIALENVNPTVIAGLIYFVAGVFLFVVHLSPLCKKILITLDTSETETKITKR